MKIAIIGAGNVGGTLGRLWHGRGHDVVFGIRKGGEKSRDLPGRSSGIAEAAREGEAVVFAVPWGGARDAVQAAGDLAGKIVIDCTNPLLPDLSGLAVGGSTSAAEQIASWAPGARVVKCFNTTGAQNFGAPQFGNERLTMFYCGNDAAAKETVRGLGAELGFDMLDTGKLERARLLESLAMLWISLAYAESMGPGIAFRLLRRDQESRGRTAG